MLGSILRGTTLLVFLALSGCGAPLSEAEIQKTAEAMLLQNFVGKLQAGDLPAVRMLLDPQTNNLPDIVKVLEQTAEILPDENPKSTEFLNWWMNTDSTSGRTSGVSAHLEYSTRWVLVTASFAGQPESMKVAGFRVDYAIKGQDGASPFTAVTSASGPIYILSLASAWITVAVLLVAAVVCVLVRGLDKKWLWMLLILFCTPGIYVEPAKATYMFYFINFGWLGGSWFQPQPGLHLVVPLGAIIFFLKLWNLRRTLPNEAASGGT